jgi:hypothetical protein
MSPERQTRPASKQSIETHARRLKLHKKLIRSIISSITSTAAYLPLSLSPSPSPSPSPRCDDHRELRTNSSSFLRILSLTMASRSACDNDRFCEWDSRGLPLLLLALLLLGLPLPLPLPLLARGLLIPPPAYLLGLAPSPAPAPRREPGEEERDCWLLGLALALLPA